MTGHDQIQAVLEALEAGNQREAAAILLDTLEDGPRIERAHCPDCCGQGFEWPGLRDAHQVYCTAARSEAA